MLELPMNFEIKQIEVFLSPQGNRELENLSDLTSAVS